MFKAHHLTSFFLIPHQEPFFAIEVLNIITRPWCLVILSVSMSLFIIGTSPSGLMAISMLGLIGWYLLSAIYVWYSLRHIPGPSLAKFSYFWLARLSLSGKECETFRTIGRQYGRLVRVGPNDLTTDDPEIIRYICSPRSRYTKSGWYEGNRFNPYHATMFSMLDTVAHDKLKGKVTPGYTGRDTPGLEGDIDIQLMSMIGLIQRKYIAPQGDPGLILLDLSRVIPLFTLDVISKIALGKEFGCLDTDSDPYDFYGTLEQHLPQMSMTTNVPWIRKIIYSKVGLMLFGPKETDRKGIGKVMGITSREVASRFTAGAENHQDMLASFVRRGLTPAECDVETLLLFFAGSHTTAGAIVITLLYLFTAPLAYQRLKEEIAAAVREKRVSCPITNAEAKKLPYLQAVVYEGLRMRPATVGMLSKVVPPNGDTLHGKFIPGGTSIGMNLALALRSKSCFGEDADAFRPERFLENGEKRRDEMQRNVDLTFGYGRWLCAGKSIAMMELNKTYFELFRAFDFQIMHPEKPMSSSSHVLFTDKNFHVRVMETATQETDAEKCDIERK
ncbi:cytochrome P450 [Xylariomycetidae sp. FL2044]|nr:cytochrome P450 [Xylariomycetidae sp. FL2044]